MLNKLFPLKFCIAIFISINCQFILAQKKLDTVSPIQSPIKEMQFGNEFLQEYKLEISKNIPNYLNTTNFSLGYRQKYLVYDPIRDPKRLLMNTGLFAGAAIASFAILWVSPESFSNWDKDKIKEEGFFKKWKENVKEGPIMDEDKFFLNWVMHPWAGGVYYMSARGSGFKMWESFVYTTLMSTLFWEYGVEAFAEVPSWQDLLITPILGSALGECFFVWKGKIIRNDKKVLNSRLIGKTSLLIMDPFNEIIDWFGYKTKNKMQTYSTIAPIDFDFTNNKPIWGLQVVIHF